MNLKHGHAAKRQHTPTYKVWVEMCRRCRKPTGSDAKTYAGIAVDPTWLEYTRFLADMGERPTGLTLDRKDARLGYGPNNCRWATTGQQARNRSNNRLFTVDGETKCLTDWCAAYGLSIQCVSFRLRQGRDITTALTTPKR